jgi:hypothetical protein
MSILVYTPIIIQNVILFVSNLCKVQDATSKGKASHEKLSSGLFVTHWQAQVLASPSTRDYGQVHSIAVKGIAQDGTESQIMFIER